MYLKCAETFRWVEDRVELFVVVLVVVYTKRGGLRD
jgi:hypothetical protein